MTRIGGFWSDGWLNSTNTRPDTVAVTVAETLAKDGRPDEFTDLDEGIRMFRLRRGGPSACAGSADLAYGSPTLVCSVI